MELIKLFNGKPHNEITEREHASVKTDTARWGRSLGSLINVVGGGGGPQCTPAHRAGPAAPLPRGREHPLCGPAKRGSPELCHPYAHEGES